MAEQTRRNKCSVRPLKVHVCLPFVSALAMTVSKKRPHILEESSSCLHRSRRSAKSCIRTVVRIASTAHTRSVISLASSRAVRSTPKPRYKGLRAQCKGERVADRSRRYTPIHSCPLLRARPPALTLTSCQRACFRVKYVGACLGRTSLRATGYTARCWYSRISHR